MHEAIAQVLRWFAYSHLPADLREVSKPFADLAEHLAGTLEGPELTVALRKLLEAKDAAVRAAVAMDDTAHDRITVND